MRKARLTRFSISVIAVTAAAMLFAGCSNGSSEKDKTAGKAEASSNDTVSGGATKPFAPLKFGQAGRVINYGPDNQKIEFEVTPLSITTGDVADLSKFNPKDEQKDSVPFYVAVGYKNVGSVSLKSPRLDADLFGYDDSYQRYSKVNPTDVLETCKTATPPETWDSGATVQSCSAFLVTQGKALVQIGYMGNSPRPLTWRK